MKPCNGCKYLTIWRGRGYCREAVADAAYEVDPTTGAGRYRPQWKYGLSFLENTTEKCREAGMPCGPDRLLFRPTLLRRLLGVFAGDAK